MTGKDELKRNWLLLVTAMIGGCMVNAPAAITGIFMPIWEEEFGWSRFEIGLAISFFVVFIVLTAPVVGRIVDQYGVRRPVLTSLILMSAAFAGVSFVNENIWTLYLAYALFAVAGSGTTAVTFTRSVGQYFETAKGLAFGIAINATTISVMVTPIIVMVLLEHFSWRGAWLGLALAPLLVFPLVFIGLKEVPYGGSKAAFQSGHAAAVPAGLATGAALRKIDFWVMAVVFALAMFAAGGTLGQLIPILRETGVSVSTAVALQGAMALGLGFSRVVCGFVIDRVFAPLVFQIVCGFAFVGFLLLASGRSELAIIAVFAVGAALGAEGDLLAFMTAKYFGLRSYGQIYGLLYGFMLTGSVAAPVIIGALYDMSGTYRIAMFVCAGAVLLSMILLFRFRGYPDIPSQNVVRSPDS